VSARWPLWGGIAAVLVEDPARLEVACEQVRAVTDAFDVAINPFREDSEISCVNRAGGVACEVSALFCEALEAALRAAWLTGGDVDPTVGPPLRLVPAEGALRVAPRQDWRHVELSPGRVRLPLGLALDLCATGKALAADRAAQAAHTTAGCGVLVSLSGDIATAGPAPRDGWAVEVGDDHRHRGSSGQTIAIHGGGLATSSLAVRPGHVLEPRARRPLSPSPWRTVSVAAATCLDANTASTAALVRGAQAPAWLRELGLPARMVAGDDSVVEVAGWAA
jgi:thiamine biosynthesis lipoprotein